MHLSTVYNIYVVLLGAVCSQACIGLTNTSRWSDSRDQCLLYMEVFSTRMAHKLRFGTGVWFVA